MLVSSRASRAQKPAAGAAAASSRAQKQEQRANETARDTAPPPMFASETPLAVTFTTNVKQLRGDKSAKAPWRAATLSYVASDAKPVMVPVRARTRGIWRLQHCEYPPVRLHVGGKEAKGTLLHGLGRPKLVNYCRDTDLYEQYIVQELQLYRIYRLLTPVSHRVRLLKVAYTDSANGRTVTRRHAFLVEDADQVAARAGGRIIESKGAGPNDLDPAQTAIAFVFAYMIGNTDFSFASLHNTEIVALVDGTILPIAYDFDFAGAVNATYATAEPQMGIARVRDRRFRGFCAFAGEYPRALALFKQRKAAIYALYRDEIGSLLPPKVVAETLAYFDDFYATIDNLKVAERDMLSSCLGAR